MHTYQTNASHRSTINHCLPRQPRSSASPSRPVEEVLRELAYVLHLSRRVRESLTEPNPIGEDYCFSV